MPCSCNNGLTFLCCVIILLQCEYDIYVLAELYCSSRSFSQFSCYNNRFPQNLFLGKSACISTFCYSQCWWDGRSCGNMSAGSCQNSSSVVQWNHSGSPVRESNTAAFALPGFGGTDSHLHVLQLRHSCQQTPAGSVASWWE